MKSALTLSTACYTRLNEGIDGFILSAVRRALWAGAEGDLEKNLERLFADEQGEALEWGLLLP